MTDELRREEDKGWFARFWEWVDKRNIDLHCILVFTLWLTWRVMHWAMDFAASHPEIDGLHMAAIIASVVTPWTAMQTAMFAFYASARKSA